jgi:tRNA pseudouridine55 synthase
VDGLLIVDKPAGPTSHDVVARVRSILKAPAVGHTGTLDPLASGVLPLVIGRATRLARFLSNAPKSYDAVVRLGWATATGDAGGRAIGEPYSGEWPARDVIDAALQPFRGPFTQQPPAFSAKKIDGRRSYKAARRAEKADAAAAPLPAPVPVSTSLIEIVEVAGGLVTLRVDCSAGFYVRALAHDLGEALGTRGHLHSLRRTRSGAATLADAVSIEALESAGGATAAERLLEGALVPMSAMLSHFPALTLTPIGLEYCRHGRKLSPAVFVPAAKALVLGGAGGEIRLLDSDGALVAIAVADRASGLLHPSIVLM